MNSESSPNRSYRFHSLVELILARLREFLREPEAIFWSYGFPLIMILALGVAFRGRPTERITVDVQNGAASEETASVLREDARFRVELNSKEDCRERLRTGKTDLVVSSIGGDGVVYEYVFDPTKPGSELARNAVDDALQRAAGREDVAKTRNREMSEPGGRYIDFLVPGLLGMGLMGGGLWAVGFALVDMRMRKLLKRFVATPMKRSHFLASLMISRLLFTIPEIIFVLLFSRFAFGVVNHGSYLTVFFFIFIGAFQFSGLGLLLACRAMKLETVSGLMNLAMIPMWIGSGIFFSAERFPEIAQPFISVLPLTPLINAIRSVMLDGAGIASLTSETAIIAAWTVLSFTLALRLFRWN